ncbi:MAG: radical SAM protein [Dysosmobacter sp.]
MATMIWSIEFASTSKITFPGDGVACMATSEANLEDFEKWIGIQTISYDKVNQQRHVLYLQNRAHTLKLMKKHAAIHGAEVPRLFWSTLDREIAPLEIASWSHPKGGYFVSFDAMPGTAKRTLALCKEAGVAMTAAGATFPYGIDPNDSNIRIAPSLPACGGAGEGHCRFLHLRKDVCIGEAGRMRYQGMVYRPPSEAYSLIVQVTYGCSHNTCAFCSMYKEKRFALRPLHEVLEDFQMARQRYRSVRRIFLADGDALIRKASELYTILDTIRELFPECERVTSYASPPASACGRTRSCKPCAAKGLTMVYMGLESGSDEVLTRMREGPHCRRDHRNGPEGPQHAAWHYPSLPSRVWAARSCWRNTPSRRPRPSTP